MLNPSKSAVFWCYSNYLRWYRQFEFNTIPMARYLSLDILFSVYKHNLRTSACNKFSFDQARTLVGQGIFDFRPAKNYKSQEEIEPRQNF